MKKHRIRHPRTMQELRTGPTRPKRRRLPTAWDDMWAWAQRCWKKYRRTQYRIK